MKLKNALIIVLGFIIASNLYSQTVKETKIFNKLINNGSLKSYNKFIKKYPNSYYIQNVIDLRDSIFFYSIPNADVLAYEKFTQDYPFSNYKNKTLEKIDELSVSDISAEDANAITLEFIKSNNLKTKIASVLAFKNHGIDYISTILINPSNSVDMLFLELNNGKWINSKNVSLGLQCKDSELTKLNLHATMLKKRIDVKNYILFSYEYSSSKSTQRKLNYKEYSLGLIEIDKFNTFYATFSGVESYDNKEVIEGISSDYDSNTAYPTPEMTFLLSYMDGLSFLKKIKDSDYFTDSAYEMWYANNISSNVSTVDYIALDSRSSIVREFNKMESVSSGNYKVSNFNFRGHTAIVLYYKSSKRYILMWLEPICQDKGKDPLLNNVFFRGKNVLNLFYYQGRRAYTKQINIATGKVL